LLSDTDLSNSIELEQLRNEKARLQEEARNLDEELRQLEARSQVLTEKIAIQELMNQNAAKQESINQLQSKISMLETRLEKLSLSATSQEAAPASESAEYQKVAEQTANAPREQFEKDDDTITVTALDNEAEISEHF
jgi:predicted nuclease with TOPRIM domain